MKVALAQMISGKDLSENLIAIESHILEASQSKAELVVFPENCLLMNSSGYKSLAVELNQSPHIFNTMSALAVSNKIGIVLGSVPLLSDESERVRAVAMCWDKNGELISQYQKIHLFDAAVSDAHGQYKESDYIAPGSDPVVFNFGEFRVGMSICYDLRFPELYQFLRKLGAEIFLVPAAFTHVTGEAHWEPLLRARAIENQAYVLGVNQGGMHSATRETFGHTMAIDPWGQIMSIMTKGPGLLFVDLSKDRLKEIRGRMPVYEHKRLVQ